MNKQIKKIYFLLALQFIGSHLLQPYCLDAEEVSGARMVVDTTIEDVRRLVLAEKGKTSESELDRRIEDTLRPVFDFEEMAKRSVGPHWNKTSVEQQKEFISLFSSLLSRTYMKKIKDIENRKVTYLNEVNHKTHVTIRTKVTSDEQETVSIDYRMHQKDGNWRAYDVIVENIGLVSNYRQEFGEIIRNQSFAGLLEQLRRKQKEKAIAVRPH